MRKIDSAFSNISIKKYEKDENVIEYSNNRDIIKSKPYVVESYEELVRKVSLIYFNNKSCVLFFRGQPKEYLENRKTTIFPNIYRDVEDRDDLQNRFQKLEEMSIKFYEHIKGMWWEPLGLRNFWLFKETVWAIIQHYGVHDFGTPFIDLTTSLHVACSFAFIRNKGEKKHQIANKGVVYVLGMPTLTDSISYSTSEELLNINLSTFGTPDAHRPYFQNGFLAGPFPLSQLDNMRRKFIFDFSRRLLAKFEVHNDGYFWGNGFDQILSELLYPKGDPFYQVCNNFKSEHHS